MINFLMFFIVLFFVFWPGIIYKFGKKENKHPFKLKIGSDILFFRLFHCSSKYLAHSSLFISFQLNTSMSSNREWHKENRFTGEVNSTFRLNWSWTLKLPFTLSAHKVTPRPARKQILHFKLSGLKSSVLTCAERPFHFYSMVYLVSQGWYRVRVTGTAGHKVFERSNIGFYFLY